MWRPLEVVDERLLEVKQEQGESIRSYIKCFFDTRATIPNVIDNDVIDYFQSGITVQSLYRDFGRNRPKR